MEQTSMYSKISVPLDGSKLAEQILPYVWAIAAPHAIPVELFTVTDPDARPPFWPPQAGKAYLQDVFNKYSLPPARAVCHVEIGKPADVIVERNRTDAGCLIAMATHGMSGLRRWLIGSVASKVIQMAVNPLLLIRPAEGVNPATPVKFTTVIVPLDGSALAEKVLPHVVSLTKTLKLEVHLIRTYQLPPNAYVVADGLIAQGPGQYRVAMQSEAELYLDGKVNQLRAEGLDQIFATAIDGEPAGEIIDIARRTDQNLIAMCSHGRTGIGRWMLGSVTEKVVQHSKDPVLVIRAT
jgi:nucleotide-binding universal stress UspA family protein